MESEDASADKDISLLFDGTWTYVSAANSVLDSIKSPSRRTMMRFLGFFMELFADIPPVPPALA